VAVFLSVWLLHRKARALSSEGPSSAAVGAGLFLWMGGAALLGVSGLLARFELRPPPFGLLIFFTVVVSIAFGLSRVGGALAALPLGWLVGLQAFRLPLELVMHRAAEEGVMPAQMSYTGWNLDIVTGATALLLAPALALGVAPRWVVAAWNALGAILLANVVTIALLSTPMAHVFGERPRDLNTFVAFFPYVWLPAVLVSTALAFHIIVARALGQGARPTA
jgi:hypothetical protein